MEWSGWRYEPATRRLFAPIMTSLTPAQGAVFEALFLAGGAPVSGRNLAAALSGKTASRDPLNCVGMTVHKINAAVRALGVGSSAVENVRRFGYRLRPASKLLFEKLAPSVAAVRREAVEALLIEELEATGPHARAVAAKIAEMYGS